MSSSLTNIFSYGCVPAAATYLLLRQFCSTFHPVKPLCQWVALHPSSMAIDHCCSAPHVAGLGLCSGADPHGAEPLGLSKWSWGSHTDLGTSFALPGLFILGTGFLYSKQQQSGRGEKTDEGRGEPDTSASRHLRLTFSVGASFGSQESTKQQLWPEQCPMPHPLLGLCLHPSTKILQI